MRLQFNSIRLAKIDERKLCNYPSSRRILEFVAIESYVYQIRISLPRTGSFNLMKRVGFVVPILMLYGIFVWKFIVFTCNCFDFVFAQGWIFAGFVYLWALLGEPSLIDAG